MHSPGPGTSPRLNTGARATKNLQRRDTLASASEERRQTDLLTLKDEHRTCASRPARGAPPPLSDECGRDGDSARRPDGGRIVLGIVAGDGVPGDAIEDELAQATHPGGDHRGAAGLGLQRHQPERLGVGGHRHHVGKAVVSGQVVVRDVAIVSGSEENVKITTELDIQLARAIYERKLENISVC